MKEAPSLWTKMTLRQMSMAEMILLLMSHHHTQPALLRATTRNSTSVCVYLYAWYVCLCVAEMVILEVKQHDSGGKHW